MSSMEEIPQNIPKYNQEKIDVSPDPNIIGIKGFAERQGISFEDAVEVYRKQILENVDSERNLKGLEQALESIK